jgi:hypothetical protein
MYVLLHVLEEEGSFGDLADIGIKSASGRSSGPVRAHVSKVHRGLSNRKIVRSVALESIGSPYTNLAYMLICSASFSRERAVLCYEMSSLPFPHRPRLFDIVPDNMHELERRDRG